MIIALCFTSWIGTARVVRSEVMYLKHSEYVLAARLSGARLWNILVTHLIPNAMGPIIVSTAFLIPERHFLRGVSVVPGHRHSGADGQLGHAWPTTRAPRS